MKLFTIPFLKSTVAVGGLGEGLVVAHSALRMRVIRKNKSRRRTVKEFLFELRNLLLRGDREDYGVVSRRCVTTVGAKWIADLILKGDSTQCAGAVGHGLGLLYHIWGTGTAAESVNDGNAGSVAQVLATPTLNYVVGTLVEALVGSNYTLTSVATLTAQANVAITEHAILIYPSVGTNDPSVFDRSLFSVKNIETGNSIQFTYTLTVQAGG